ncbi:MAG TPA: hypothetical protein VF043_30410 [Ktedonobacteraceae bacterium]
MVKKENKFSWTMLITLGFIAFITQNIVYPIPSRNISTIALILWCFFALVSIGQVATEIRNRIRLNQQREAAARGETQKLAQKQPDPDPHALTLPLRIQHLPRNGMWIGLLYLYTVCFVILEIVDISTALQPVDAMRDLHVQLAIIFPVMLVVLWIATWLYRSQQWLEVTDDGLAFRSLISKKAILWKDARLFAVHLPISASRPIFATDDIFELSSAKRIIHWTWRKGWFPSQVVRTKVHPETYQQQLQGLLSIIRAKTGLSLYDFR